MKVTGIIRTIHHDAPCVAAAVAADNLQEMETRAVEADGQMVVETIITSTKIRSVIASVDDYLTNITVAEELCRKTLAGAGQEPDQKDQTVS